MKPTKNRVFCKDCGRHKMLFETEKKAETFIRFNSEEIDTESGYSPVRSYYCMFCNGWHVTSKSETLRLKSKTEVIIEKYSHYKEARVLERKKNIELRDKSIKTVEDQIKIVETIKASSDKTDIDRCVEILNAALAELEIAKNRSNNKNKKKIKNVENRLHNLKNQIEKANAKI